MEALQKPDYRYLTVYEVLNLASQDLPLVVLSDNMQSWFSRHIKFWSNFGQHRKHRYSHAFWLITPETVATQAWVFKTEPLTKWVQDHIRLKFFYCSAWDDLDRQVILHRLSVALKKPWYQRIYDAPALLGQWCQSVFGWGRWLQIPFLHFCVSQTLKPIRIWTPGLPQETSPAHMDAYFENSPHWQCYGVYDASKGLNGERLDV